LKEQWGESVMLNNKNKKGLSHPRERPFSFKIIEVMEIQLMKKQ
jgi:hypothetical protein